MSNQRPGKTQKSAASMSGEMVSTRELVQYFKDMHTALQGCDWDAEFLAEQLTEHFRNLPKGSLRFKTTDIGL